MFGSMFIATAVRLTLSNWRCLVERVLLISWYKAAISLPSFRVLSSSSTMVASS